MVLILYVKLADKFFKEKIVKGEFVDTENEIKQIYSKFNILKTLKHTAIR